MDSFLTLVFVLVTWRRTECGLILVLSVCVGDLEIDSMVLILDFSVCVGDLERDRIWIGCMRW